jgi:hypothetical protein
VKIERVEILSYPLKMKANVGDYGPRAEELSGITIED